MAGLTDQAGGMKVSGGEAIEHAHQAWQEINGAPDRCAARRGGGKAPGQAGG